MPTGISSRWSPTHEAIVLRTAVPSPNWPEFGIAAIATATERRHGIGHAGTDGAGIAHIGTQHQAAAAIDPQALREAALVARAEQR